ncbi:MAG: DUF1016 N-terminal domain-containing protein [Pirellula sp.]|jgi:predicted nuclease of restriction endonuclease-like (RecB) superfamily|nr:DUF1016 N-terminal domain-containing protein [Pirellula sp.]
MTEPTRIPIALYRTMAGVVPQPAAQLEDAKAIVQKLATDLQKEFPGVSGFSASNLWRMRAFFELYRGLEKLAPLVREIGWSQNIAIMERRSDPLKPEFYLPMTRKFGWSKNVLIHQDEYTFDFLELAEEHSERELEQSLPAA